MTQNNRYYNHMVTFCKSFSTEGVEARLFLQEEDRDVFVQHMSKAGYKVVSCIEDQGLNTVTHLVHPLVYSQSRIKN